VRGRGGKKKKRKEGEKKKEGTRKTRKVRVIDGGSLMKRPSSKWGTLEDPKAEARAKQRLAGECRVQAKSAGGEQSVLVLVLLVSVPGPATEYYQDQVSCFERLVD
jgi:hypothetical protein